MNFSVLSFDELNRIVKPRTMSNEKFFGEMALTERQKRERIEFEEDLEDELVPVFASLFIAALFGVVAWADIREQLVDAYMNALAGHVEADDVLREQAAMFADNFVDATIRNSDSEWFYSADRAKFDAQNEANTVYNYKDFKDALLTGKTHKRWRAILDKRTRETHWNVSGQTQPIEEPFVVGDGWLMMFPRDQGYGAPADEIVNCRCTALYY